MDIFLKFITIDYKKADDYIFMPMKENNSKNLRQKIIEEMMLNSSFFLEENFYLAKKFIRLTKEGSVRILPGVKLTGQDRILLYLIGKWYAKEAGFTTSEEVGNSELMRELKMARGTLLPSLKRLREKGLLQDIKRGRLTYHRVPLEFIGRILKNIQSKTSVNEELPTDF